MEYNAFLAMLQEKLKSYLDKVGFEGKTRIRKVLKNNGVELDALIVVREDTSASPTIYLNCYYEQYMVGRNVEDIIKEIYSMFSRKLEDIDFSIEEFTDFNKIKDRIVYKVINTEKNKRLLDKIPHIDILDLSIVFYCIIKCDKSENATTLIYNHNLPLWGVKVEELFEIAKENTPKQLPWEIRSMEDIILEMISEKSGCQVNEAGYYNGEEYNMEADELTSLIMEEIRKEDEPKMYVLTNVYRMHGAATMFYEGVLKSFAEEHQKDIIILPSSVHEVIIIPVEKHMAPEDFESVINEVNEEQVIPEEVLSNHAYIYVRSDDKIYIR